MPEIVDGSGVRLTRAGAAVPVAGGAVGRLAWAEASVLVAVGGCDAGWGIGTDTKRGGLA